MDQLELSPVDPLADAVAWKAKNPAAYEQLVTWSHEDVSHHAQPSIGLYAELLRRPHFANKLRLVRSDVSFLLNNNLRSGLARLIERDYPWLSFRKRRAWSDIRQEAIDRKEESR
jgi:hypothetical protein